jgi:hypothetical protein
VLTGLILLLAVLVGGCSGLPLPGTSPRTLPEGDLKAAPEESTLQIVVTYSGLISTHSAVRLVHYERGVLFWDPAGIYGVGNADDDGSPPVQGIGRTNDLIIEGAPNLRTYWNFALSTGDSGMEVLEWRLTPERAEEFYEVLLSGAGLSDNSIDFHTAATAPFCTVAVSEFLQRFGGELVRVPNLYLFPGSLAEVLLPQTPRILVFLRGKPPLEFRNGAR